MCVSAICPGFVATPLSTGTVGLPAARIDERLEGMVYQHPTFGVGEPEDIANMALYLASDRSTFVTGQAIVVDGGAATGVSWEDQRDVYKQYYPIKVYNPDKP